MTDDLRARAEETIASLIGEGVHTFFRKFCESDEANQIWHLIKKMPNAEWNLICDGVAEEILRWAERDGEHGGADLLLSLLQPKAEPSGEEVEQTAHAWEVQHAGRGAFLTKNTQLAYHAKQAGIPVLPLYTSPPASREREDLPEIVCLCGSTRFAEAWKTATRELSLAGKIVLSVGVMLHAGDEPIRDDGPEKRGLDELHLRKIDLCDRVLVLNVGGYIGESTRREIGYAGSIGRPITYLEPVDVLAEEGDERE